MRDHTKLRAFELADKLAMLVYRLTVNFPKEERYGLTAQMRRSAVSITCNIVEGCARNSLAEYLRFLDIAYGSSRELEYQLSLAQRLGYLGERNFTAATEVCEETVKVLNGLIRALRKKI